MGGGGDNSASSGENYDKEYNARIASVAERETDMAEGIYDFYISDYQPMEKAQIAANLEMIPSETALSIAQNEANLSLLDGQTDLAKSQTESSLSLLPGQTRLTQKQIDDQLTSMNERAPVRTKFYQESLDGVDVESKANKAAADVAQAFAGSTDAMNRDLARMGVNPNSGRFTSTATSKALERAKLIGSAKTQARDNAEKENYTRLTTAMGTA
ncbi:MAG: hypothetical protein MI802_09065 [Desulfobacterales bacterium]|nr:hypothetical protein [Desulfobacterales bacterium]